jgi:hypothetical protein
MISASAVRPMILQKMQSLEGEGTEAIIRSPLSQLRSSQGVIGQSTCRPVTPAAR